MNTLIKLSAAVLCAIGLTSCESLPFYQDTGSNAPEIRTISLGHTDGCRFISHVEGASTFPPDKDLYLAVMAQVRAKAAEQSANAMLVRTYQVESGPRGSRATATADVYSCTFKDGE